MLALRLYQSGNDAPVLTASQGDTSFLWTKDGITVTIVESTGQIGDEKHYTLHKWERVTRIDRVNTEDLCPVCGIFNKGRMTEICYRCAQKESQGNPIEIKTRESAAGGMIFYDCVYPLETPFEKIQAVWFNLYHPAGYSTTVSERVDEEAGRRYVKVSRFSSCD